MLLISLALGAEPSATVTGRFGWEAGDAWRVAYTQRAVREGAVSSNTSVSATWTIRVVKVGSELVVHAEDFVLAPPTGFPPTNVSGLFTATAMATFPSFAITPGGAFAGMRDATGARAAMNGALAATAFRTEGARAEVQALVPDAQLEQFAAEHWRGTVELWLSQELTPGVPVTQTTLTPVPALGNALVELEVRRVYQGPAPCFEGDTGMNCERFTAESGLAPGAIEAVLAERANAITAAQGGATAINVRSLRMDSTMTLVTEADDLRPRSLEVKRNMDMSARVSGQDVVARQTETRSWTYTPL